MTAANQGGNFTFTTMLVPVDCVGTLSDGSASIDVRVEGCSDVTTGLPGTGQTTIYAPGDDGDVGAGGPLSYPDNGDGTVTDNRAGLTWEKKTDANVTTVYPWEDALEYVAELNAMNGGAGFAATTTGGCPTSGSSQHRRLRPCQPVDRPDLRPDGRWLPVRDVLVLDVVGGVSPPEQRVGRQLQGLYANPSGILRLGKASGLRVRRYGAACDRPVVFGGRLSIS